MDRVQQWLEDDSDWFSKNRELLDMVFDCFMRDGEWPKVATLRRQLFQQGTKGIDVEAVANSKPAIPAQLTMAIQERITLGARHLRHMPKATTLLDLLVHLTNEAVRAYQNDGEAPSVHYDNPDFFKFDSTTIIRLLPFITADYPNPVGGGNYGEEWSLFVNEALILEFEEVTSPSDYVDRQTAIVRKWVERMIPMAKTNAPSEGDPKSSLLREQVRAANEGAPEDITTWKERSATALRVALGQGHPLVSSFAKIKYSPVVTFSGTTTEDYAAARRSGVKRGIAILDSALLELGMRETDGQSVAPENAVESLSGVVFIVHGHDTNSLVDVAHTISRLTGEDPVILHEQPNRGQTIIEKFERHATDAGFVVVLATADDLGRAKDATDLNPRARQNVVFELGYFIGALGRPKVAVLYDEGVELPSDMAGVVYIPNDSAGGWRLTLAREMRAAGLHADSNRI